MTNLKIGGLQPLTTIDYPGELAAVVFCQGCPWRCRYCQNVDLLPRQGENPIAWQEVFDFLQYRRGLLDAVVFSGGEPTMQQELADAIAQVRSLGFKVGLHTAGCYPVRLAQLIPLVDWIGLDIKTLPEHYSEITGIPISGERAWQSLRLLLDSDVANEVRVTVHDRLLPENRLNELIEQMIRTGVKNLALQQCRWEPVLDPELGPSSSGWKEGVNRFSQHFESIQVR